MRDDAAVVLNMMLLVRLYPPSAGGICLSKAGLPVVPSFFFFFSVAVVFVVVWGGGVYSCKDASWLAGWPTPTCMSAVRLAVFMQSLISDRVSLCSIL